MTPTDPPEEEAAAPGDPIRMALGALVASCYAGYRRAKQVKGEPARPDGEAGDVAGPAPGAEDGGPPPRASTARPAR